MRATINGVVVELSVAEFRELFQQQLKTETLEAPKRKEAPVDVLPVKKERHYNLHGNLDALNKWKGTDMKEWSSEEIKTLKELYPYRTREDLSKTELKGRTPAAIQLKACSLGVKKIVFHTGGKKGRRMKKNEEPQRYTGFPLFETIDDDSNRILVDMLRNIVRDKGSLKFSRDGFAIGITDVKSWYEFLRELSQKSSAVSSFFGVRNNFSIAGSEVHYA